MMQQVFELQSIAAELSIYLKTVLGQEVESVNLQDSLTNIILVRKNFYSKEKHAEVSLRLEYIVIELRQHDKISWLPNDNYSISAMIEYANPLAFDYIVYLIRHWFHLTSEKPPHGCPKTE